MLPLKRPYRLGILASSLHRTSADDELYLRHSAINAQIYSSNVRTLIRSEKCSSSHLFRPADASQWQLRQDGAFELSELLFSQPHFCEDRSVNRTGTDRIDTDLAIFEFRSPRSSKGTHRCFGRVINATST